MENDFSNAKLGDTVWDSQRGFGIIKAIRINTDNPETGNPIGVKFSDDYVLYTIKGYSRKSDINPALFWDEIKIIPPPKPKRKIEKTIEGWLNIYPDPMIDKMVIASVCYLYTSREAADAASDTFSRLGEAYHVIHKYTIEE